METIYDAVGGHPVLVQLAEAWHRRALADVVLNHPFSHPGRPDHTERLASYWGEALGGPPRYTERYGDESSVVRLHSGNGEHPQMNDSAVARFDEAMDDIGIVDQRVRTALHDYFCWAARVSMGAYPHSADAVPDGLTIPRWGFDGPLT